MKDWSRRHVLRATAGAAIAVPMAALGGGLAAAAEPAGAAATGPQWSGDDRTADVGPVMFCVHDAQRGEVSILHGTARSSSHDRQLVARILRPPIRRDRRLKAEGQACLRIVRRRRSPRTRLPTTPTPTPLSAPIAGHRHHHQQLHPAGGSGRRARTSSSSATTCSTGSTSTTPATAGPTSSTNSGSTRTMRNPDTFLYNTGPITALDSQTFNRPQTYTVTEVRGNAAPVGRGIADPALQHRSPVHARTTRTWPTQRSSGRQRHSVFAGQRLDGFYVDLGAVFDLAVLRPFQNLHLIPTPATGGVNALRAFNVHTIAIQVPIGAVDPQRQGTHRPDGPRSGDRRLGVGTPAEGPVPGRTTATVGRRAVHPGVPAGATRCSTRSSCRWATRTDGTGWSPGGTPSSPST